jgi:hypothetical protein
MRHWRDLLHGDDQQEADDIMITRDEFKRVEPNCVELPCVPGCDPINMRCKRVEEALEMAVARRRVARARKEKAAAE